MDINDDKPSSTKMGTPRALSWDQEWLTTVDIREIEIGRRICGARTLSGTPCPMGSNHPTGRCPHHGGFNLTGAPKGNRNAVIHGLYSQRLAICGKHCPMWQRCPTAGDHILALAPDERPLCPYEQELFETTLTDELGEEAVAMIANYWTQAFAPTNAIDEELKKILKQAANAPP